MTSAKRLWYSRHARLFGVWRWLGALLTLWGAAAAAQPTPPEQAVLNADLQALLKQERLAGAVFATVHGGRVQTGAVGNFNAKTGTPLRADARVHLGSVAKTLLSLCVLRLVSQGRVSLDTPVHTLLPALPLQNPWHDTHPVRLRHLLDHTAGLEDMHLWHLFNRNHRADMPLAASFAQHADVLRVRTQPGTRMSYSNLGYTLAGMVIESVTQERYEAWGQRELLQVLQMHDSSFDYTTQQGPQADPRLAWGHLDDFQPQAAMAVAPRPGAQFTSTAADMARLALFLMSDGQVDGRPFIHGALLRQMGHASQTEAARAGLATGYALGLAVRDRHGAVGLCHEGSVLGFRAQLCLYPQLQRAYFIAHNTDSETAQYARFAARLVQALDLSSAAPAGIAAATSSSNLRTPTADWNGRYVLAPSRFEPFALLDLVFDTRSWSGDDVPATWQRVGGAALPMWPAGGATQRQDGRVQASHALLRQADGARLISDGFNTFRRVSMATLVGVWLSLGLGAAGLLCWLVLPVVRRLRQGAPLVQPGWVAVLLVLLPLPLLAWQSWPALGEVSVASASLALVTLLLPLLMLWQAWRLRTEIRTRVLDLASALAVVQACGLLAAWGLLPLALWQ